MQTLRDHLFVSSTSGDLYDVRGPNWSAKPLRANYARHHTTIASTADYKATLRAGPFAWPGGYPLFFICDDGGALCFDCARKELREVMHSLLGAYHGDGWHVVGCDVNYEDSDLLCDHCNKAIESAYGHEPNESGASIHPTTGNCVVSNCSQACDCEPDKPSIVWEDS